MEETRPGATEETPDAKITPDPVDPDQGNVDDTLETVPMSDLRKVRKEAERYRLQLRALEKKQTDDEEAARQAEMTEIQKLKAQAQVAKAQQASMKAHSENVLRRSAIINAASVANFQNPQDAAALLDISAIDVDEDSNIDPQQVVELVKALAEERSYLLKGANPGKPGAEFGPTSPSGDNAPGVKLTGAAAIEKLKGQAEVAMRAGKMNTAVKLMNQKYELEHGT